MGRVISIAQAMHEVLQTEMRRDPEVYVMGEDASASVGAFQAFGSLVEEFGPHRVIDAPMAEPMIVGSAVGAAITGSRPIIILNMPDLLLASMDEVYNKAAKWRYMHGGLVAVPVTYLMGSGISGSSGAEHWQCPEALFMHCPGLKIAVPGTAYDVKGLLTASIRDNNPVLFIGHKLLTFTEGEAPEESYEIPLGKADIKRAGKDVTIIAWHLMLQRSLEAAERLDRVGISAEVVDPRTLLPLDKETILASVRKTRRAVVVHEAPRTAGPGAEIAAMISEEAMYDLQAPVRRIAGADVPLPQSLYLEQFCVPSVEQIVSGVRSVF